MVNVFGNYAYYWACNSFNQRRIALFDPHPDLTMNPSLVCQEAKGVKLRIRLRP